MSVEHRDNVRTALIDFLGDYARCSCGNRPEAEGFFPSSQGGSYMEPLEETWLGYYRCDRCGVVGHPEEVSE